MEGLNPDAFELLANESGAIIIDVRHQIDFVKGHIPQSIFIGLDGDFAPWVGALIGNVKQPLLIISPEGREEETITRLSRVGFDHTMGYLEGGFEAWKNSGKECDVVNGIVAKDLVGLIKEKKVTVFDVRNESEYISQHIPNSQNTPLGFLNDHLSQFSETDTFYVHCAGGYRSVIAASILKKRGFHNLVDIQGGFKAIKETNIDLSDYICLSKIEA
jgi:rhodanese-related sulfurtransferase